MTQSKENGIENLESTNRAEDLAVTSKNKEDYEQSIDSSEVTSAETCRAGLDE